MCGIAGTAGFSDPDLLRRMTRLIAYRGPDEEGYYEDGTVGLGHRRLSIIDLATGAQPMWSDDGRSVIVFNGEIYNYRELRHMLERRGIAFRTTSDTEVIVNLYQVAGPDAARWLNGIFAFAIWDTARRRLVLARDQLGVKPLLYHAADGALLFASEAKCLLEWNGYAPALDPEGLRRSLALSYVPGERTLFAGLRKLLPGHVLTWQGGRTEVRPFWSGDPAEDWPAPVREIGLDQPPLPPPGDEEGWRRGVVDLLGDAVQRQMVADVPLGATLSGGLDSSTIVALMSRASERPVVTFTVGFGGKKDELDHARRVADHCRTDHHEFIVDPQHFTEALPRVLWHLEEPILSSILPTWYLGEAARRLVTVILIGEGADELFAGYRRFWPVADRFRRLVPAAVKRGFYFWHFSSVGAAAGDPLWSPGFARRLADENPRDAFYGRAMRARADQLNGLLLHEQRYQLPDFQLLRIDRLTMAHSVEARVPFLDPRLVRYVNAMPSRLKLRGNTEKYILRRAASALLPESILARRKQGLGTPLIPWFRNGLGDLARDLLSPANVRARGLFEPAAVDRLFDSARHTTLHREDLGKLFKLVMVELWQRTFLDSPRATRSLPRPESAGALTVTR